MSIDREELERIVRMVVTETVPTTVRHTLEHYGVDVAHPSEVQRDQQFLRSARTFAGSLLAKVLTAVMLGGVAAAAVAIAQGKIHIGG